MRLELKKHAHRRTNRSALREKPTRASVRKDEMPDIPDCGIAFATLAAAERLLVLGEPVGALLVVSYIREKRKKKNKFHT